MTELEKKNFKKKQLTPLEALKELKDYGFYYSKEGFDISTFVQMRLDIIEDIIKENITLTQKNIVYLKVIEERDKLLDKYDFKSMNELDNFLMKKLKVEENNYGPNERNV